MRKQIIGEQCHQPPEAPTASPFQVPAPPPAARRLAASLRDGLAGSVSVRRRGAFPRTDWRPRDISS